MYKNKLLSFSFDIRLIFSFLLIIFLPHFYFVAFSVSSPAIGLIFASFIVMLLNYKSLTWFKLNYKDMLIIYSLIIVLYLTTLFLYTSEDESKPLFSLIILMIFFSAFLLEKYIQNLSYQGISNAILFLIFLLLVLGWLKIFFVPSCSNYALHVKPVFPFSEESHYALALGMFAVAYAAVGNIFLIIFIGMNMFILALLYPNMTLSVFSVLIFFTSMLRIRPIFFKIILAIMPIFIGIVLVVLMSSSEYFSSRLNFEGTKNLTTLVFLQGWELAYQNLVETNGIGLGFQMLGSPATHLGTLTDEIIKITNGKKYNLADGGFLASKVIAEFGIFGIILIVSYVYFLLKFIFNSNKLWQNIRLSLNLQYRQELKKKLLISGVLFGFLVEVFLRGYGYFSPGFFLALVAIFYLRSNPEEKFIYNKSES